MIYIIEYGLYLFLLVATIHLTSKLIGITPSNHKFSSLDGLRGVCAALVTVFHLYWRAGGQADTYWSLDYITTSEVKRAIHLTGELSVGVFFMLSGFLFFRKALSEKFNLKDFITSRFLRIYPPVIATLILLYFSTLIMNEKNHTPIWEWFLPSLPFIFHPPGANINGFSLQILTSGVFWTLVWELRLYFAIPFLYIIMKKIKHKSLFVVLLMVIILLYKETVSMTQELSFIMYFLAGFLVATINKETQYSNWTCIILLLLALFFTRHAYNTTTPLYIMIVFYTIKCGCDYFGSLNSTPIKMLGTCSFSLYLVHGICQTFTKHYLYQYDYYLWQICSIIVAGIIAPIMYKYVERLSSQYRQKKGTLATLP